MIPSMPDQAARLRAETSLAELNETSYRLMIVSPHSLSGGPGDIQSHLWVATFIGVLILAMPVTLGLARSGEILTCHVIAVLQMPLSALLIHVTGGRIEMVRSRFPAFHRDWKVLISGFDRNGDSPPGLRPLHASTDLRCGGDSTLATARAHRIAGLRISSSSYRSD